MWKYITKEFSVTEYEGYNGYMHKYEQPKHYIRHRIVRLGKTGNILETIVDISLLDGTRESIRTTKNFQTIVDAVNGELPESGNGPVC